MLQNEGLAEPSPPACSEDRLIVVLGKTLEQLEGKVEKGAKAISLIKVCDIFRNRSSMADGKGVDVKGADIHIFADVIEKRLGVSCSALSGANIADEVAKDRFSETTIGYRKEEEGKMWQKLFGELRSGHIERGKTDRQAPKTSESTSLLT